MISEDAFSIPQSLLSLFTLVLHSSISNILINVTSKSCPYPIHVSHPLPSIPNLVIVRLSQLHPLSFFNIIGEDALQPSREQVSSISLYFSRQIYPLKRKLCSSHSSIPVRDYSLSKPFSHDRVSCHNWDLHLSHCTSTGFHSPFSILSECPRFNRMQGRGTDSAF